MQVHINSWRDLIYQFTVCEVYCTSVLYKTPARPAAVNQKRFAGRISKSVTNVHVWYLNEKNWDFFCRCLKCEGTPSLFTQSVSRDDTLRSRCYTIVPRVGVQAFLFIVVQLVRHFNWLFKYGAGNILFLFVDTHRVWRTRWFASRSFVSWASRRKVTRDNFLYYFP